MRPIGARSPGVLCQRRYNGEQDCSGQDCEKSHAGYHTPAASGLLRIQREIRTFARETSDALSEGSFVESDQACSSQRSAHAITLGADLPRLVHLLLCVEESKVSDSIFLTIAGRVHRGHQGRQLRHVGRILEVECRGVGERRLMRCGKRDSARARNIPQRQSAWRCLAWRGGGRMRRARSGHRHEKRT